MHCSNWWQTHFHAKFAIEINCPIKAHLQTFRITEPTSGVSNHLSSQSRKGSGPGFCIPAMTSVPSFGDVATLTGEIPFQNEGLITGKRRPCFKGGFMTSRLTWRQTQLASALTSLFVVGNRCSSVHMKRDTFPSAEERRCRAAAALPASGGECRPGSCITPTISCPTAESSHPPRPGSGWQQFPLRLCLSLLLPSFNLRCWGSKPRPAPCSTTQPWNLRSCRTPN